LSGQLIVTQTPENQALVASVLQQLREGRAVQITVETRYVFLDRRTLEGSGGEWAAGPGKKAAFLTDEKVAAFLKAAQTSKGMTLLMAPRLTTFNGQRARVAVGSQTPYVSNYVTVRTKEGDTRYEPVRGTVESGVVLDLRTTAAGDRRSVTMTIRSRTTELRGMKSRPFAADPGMKVEEPDVSTQTTETTLNIPEGETAVLVAMTPVVPGRTGDGQTFMLIKPTVIVQREEPATEFPLLRNPGK
jgi:type II secretory pathway component GspD/PulD (secretin)